MYTAATHRAVGRILAEEIRDDPEVAGEVSYTRWLCERFGRPMQRAIIRSRQRYEASKPANRRMSALRRAYDQRRRGRR